ncbi:MAG TPA: hypothetical protein DEU95_15460 [Chloroflexi bacterium]|nr:hypothetical protein [Chloroflexota bacterium]
MDHRPYGAFVLKRAARVIDRIAPRVATFACLRTDAERPATALTCTVAIDTLHSRSATWA